MKSHQSKTQKICIVKTQMSHWSFNLLLILMLFVSTKVVGQSKGVEDKSKKVKSFNEKRRGDITKLINVTQPGVKLNYNKDKSNIEGTVGREFDTSKNHPLFVNLNGTVGTTTDLTTIMNQKVLPTFSGSLTFTWILASKYFYDGSFNTNRNLILSSSATNTGTNKFTYKKSFRERIKKENILNTDTVYTFKRFFWLNVSGKYENNKYSFFDATKAFKQQLTQTSYAGALLNLNLNGYLYWNKTDFQWKGYWRPDFIYFNLGLKYGFINNVEQLKKTTVNDVTKTITDTVSHTTRQVITTQSGYVGNYVQFMAFTPFAEILYSPFGVFAFDFFGEWNGINKNNPFISKSSIGNLMNYGSAGVGLYFYGSGERSNINLGVYYKWTQSFTDIGWKGQIGLKTSIPIAPLK